MNKKPVILSGIQPSGELHVGNFLGSLKNFVELQNSGKYDCYFFVADLHAMTGDCKPEELAEKTRGVVMDYLAAGLDPKKSTLFVQSLVDGHTELAWIFNTLVPTGELKRMRQFNDKSGILGLDEIKKQLTVFLKPYAQTKEGEMNKALDETIKPRNYLDKIIKNKSNRDEIINILSEITAEVMKTVKKYSGEYYSGVWKEFIKMYDKEEKKYNKTNVGLFDYPVLQAADILLYRAGVVPVGEDQIQHVELTRKIVRLFNKKYGQYFIEPKVLLTSTPRVMSLLEPAKKMSKSLGSGHYLGISEAPEMISKKLKKAVSDSGDGNSAGGTNLLLLLEEFAHPEAVEYFFKQKKDKKIKFGELKDQLAGSIAVYFEEFREKRRALASEKKFVDQVIREGSAKAAKVAAKTMREVKEKVGLI